jgi:hypothetical protein
MALRSRKLSAHEMLDADMDGTGSAMSPRPLTSNTSSFCISASLVVSTMASTLAL